MGNRVTCNSQSKVLACINGIPTLMKSGTESECFDYCMDSGWVAEIDGGATVSLTLIPGAMAPHC